MCNKCIPINRKTATALENFSTWLHVRMAETDTTQAELAQYVGCTRKTISAILRGATFPRLDQMVMIFDYFDKKWVQVPFDKEYTNYGN